MALDQSALLELLGELHSTDVSDRIRLATQKLYQELIDAEATAFIGAAPYERSGGAVSRSAMARVLGRFQPRPGVWICGSRSCGRGRSSRRCWSAAAGSIRPCSRW